MSKQKITAYLIQHNHLWSYDTQQVEKLPDSILIEHALLYSDVEGLFLLFESFDKEDIRQVWEQKIVPHRRYHKLNVYLGLFFFRIPDIRTFLEQRIVEYPRLRRLELLASENEAGTP
ncbi:MAG: hypothetical protein GVY26_00495 [Bacteroidetes bacterium]|nr:hypothetical protein [Bacteroidota bacterium]